MGAILVKDVLWQACILLGDVRPQFVKFTERELVMWFNDAQRIIAKYIPQSCTRVDAIKLAPGTRQSIRSIPANRIIPSDGSAPKDTRGQTLVEIIRNMGADGHTPGYAIRLVPRRDLDALTPNWHNTPGDGVIEQYVFDPRMPTDFYVQPGAPASPATWIEAAFQAIPDEIPNTGTPGAELYLYQGSSTQTFSLGDQYVDDLVTYVAARGGLKSPDLVTNAAGLSQQFLSSINAQAKIMTGTNPNLKALPLAPEPVAAAS